MTVIERSGKTDNGTKVVAGPGICCHKMFLATQSRFSVQSYYNVFTRDRLAYDNGAHTYTSLYFRRTEISFLVNDLEHSLVCFNFSEA